MLCVAMIGMHFGWRERLKNLADAHFPHDTPRIFVVDLPVACFTRAREPGSTPSNRRAPRVWGRSASHSASVSGTTYSATLSPARKLSFGATWMNGRLSVEVNLLLLAHEQISSFRFLGLTLP